MKFKVTILAYFLLFILRRDHRKSSEAMRMVRNRRSRYLLRHLKKSPYYAHFSTGNGIEDFPVINKDIFMKNFDTINTVGLKKEEAFSTALKAETSRDFSTTINGITVGLSTGTSGNKGIFLASERERAQWAAAVIHRVVGFSLKPRKVAFFLRANSRLYESAASRLLKFDFFDLMEDHEINFNRLVRLKADILVAQPSALLKIASSYTEKGIVPGFAKVISVAEVLNPSDRDYLEKAFRLPLDEVYQCTEGFLACTCKYGKMHFNEDFLIIEKEYIDRATGRYFPIITDLYRRTQPVIRYKLDDVLVEGAACTCGSHFQVIERIEGRADDIIKLKDDSGRLIDIFPDYISRAIVTSSDHITDYMVSQTSDNLIEVYINNSTDEIKLTVKNNIISLLQKFNINSAIIQFNQTKLNDQGTKLRRIKNEYFKTMQDNRNG